ncbi:adenosylcobinamide-GDP ribazoletransferase [Halalkalibacter urbisdiaboli]|uniref:adenosylcobinamide-GDP ribazoletransferase n=1 Tax=Halalkalibacter urbisdiaboli TaxID=1960589 RepID=UPI001FD8B4E6|nr:adenosylcobinamide-GDP ribazoletransferase [Halalkalibacter urbisdiaboli]
MGDYKTVKFMIRDGILLAFQLLTTIPIRKEVPWDNERAQWSVAAYPLTGLMLGLLLAIQAYVLLSYTSLSLMIITAWLLTFSIVYSGGLHLDGWADFSDAVFSRREREKKLEIMKDSRIGAFGVLSLLVLLGWRYLFMYEAILLLGDNIVFVLLTIPFLTRLFMGFQILFGRFAREHGMARALLPAKCPFVKRLYALWVMLFIGCTVIWQPLMLALLLAGFLFFIVWLQFCNKQIGGVTGDTIGASTEGGETWLWLVLLLLLAFVTG